MTASSSLLQLQNYLRQTLRVATTDGRIFLGTFAGTDKQLNILLMNTDEFRLSPPENANPDGRFVGLVMIPRRLISKIEAHTGGAGGKSSNAYTGADDAYT
ncbi:hypothetical protein C8Q75DRAFT_802283 [Abortiporus biennis]|nr:hypothetical protein C8Q75DRAFT_802283 [Abortiporus biennis]